MNLRGEGDARSFECFFDLLTFSYDEHDAQYNAHQERARLKINQKRAQLVFLNIETICYCAPIGGSIRPICVSTVSRFRNEKEKSYNRAMIVFAGFTGRDVGVGE